MRRGLMGTVKDLTRDELDRAVDRDGIWEAVIAPRFNYPSVHVVLDLTGKVYGVDASAAPLARRFGEKLLDVFNKNKAIFTNMYKNWTASGSNDTDFIGDFVSLRRSSGEPNEEARRALITFFALLCGTPDADTDLLDFTLKTAPGGVAYNDDDDSVDVHSRLCGSARKRKRQEEAETAALVEVNSILKEGMSTVVHSLSSRMATYDASKAEKAKDVASLTKELVSLYDLLDSAKRTGKPILLVQRIQMSIDETMKALNEIEGREAV